MSKRQSRDPQDSSSSETVPSVWQNWRPERSDAEPGELGSLTGAPADLPVSSPFGDTFLNFDPLPQEDLPTVWDFPNSDDGRAAFFLKHFGKIVRYVPEIRQWRVWHRGRWHGDSTGRVGHYCQLLSRHQIAAAARYLDALTAGLGDQIAAAVRKDEGAATLDPTPRRAQKLIEKEYQRAKRQAESLGDERTIRTLLEAAARDASVIVPLAKWDASPHLIGTLNGTLELIHCKHRPGLPEDYITKTLNANYDPSALCPEWDRFIARVLSSENADYVQNLAGYSLTGSTNDQAFYLLYGIGKNGKSILVATLAGVFHDYAGKARRVLIEEPRNGADCRHDLAQLPGVRFLYGEETSSNGRLREDVMKGLTAGDTLTGEAKYGTPFPFIPVAKFWAMGNKRPRIEGTDPGIWRRVRVIPFTAIITEEEEVPASDLLARFDAERSGILNWMLAGLASGGFGPIPAPASVKTAIAEYRESEDVLGEFIAERTRDAPAGYKESKQRVFKAYSDWAMQNGIRHALSMKQLTRRLGEREGWKLDPRRAAWEGKSVIDEH